MWDKPFLKANSYNLLQHHLEIQSHSHDVLDDLCVVT